MLKSCIGRVWWRPSNVVLRQPDSGQIYGAWPSRLAGTALLPPHRPSADGSVFTYSIRPRQPEACECLWSDALAVGICKTSAYYHLLACSGCRTGNHFSQLTGGSSLLQCICGVIKFTVPLVSGEVQSVVFKPDNLIAPFGRWDDSCSIILVSDEHYTGQIYCCRCIIFCS